MRITPKDKINFPDDLYYSVKDVIDVVFDFKYKSELSSSTSIPFIIPNTHNIRLGLRIHIPGQEPYLHNFSITWDDAGTIGWASSNQEYAICGHVTDVSIDWSEDSLIKHPGIIHFCGSMYLKENKMNLTFFFTPKIK